MKRPKKHPGDFLFERARRVTPEELESFRRAIRATQKRLGRPPKPEGERYRAVSIRLHPQALAWAKKEGKKRGLGYQSVINETLLKAAAR